MADSNLDDPRAVKVKTAYKKSREAFEEARRDSEKAMRYVNNDSWSKEDEQSAIKAKKPHLKYNIMMSILQAIVGNEQLSAKRGHIKANTVESAPMVDVIQNRWNMLNDEQELEEQIQLAFSDALITKLGGYIERRFVVNELGYLDFQWRVTNNMRIHLDPDSITSDFTLDKTRWLVKEGWEPLDVAEEIYGEQTEFGQEKKTGWWFKLQSWLKRFNESAYSNSTSEGFDKENDRYLILEMEERVTEKFIKAYDKSTNEYVRLKPKEYQEQKKTNKNLQFINEDWDDKIHITTIMPFFDDLVIRDEDYKQAEGVSNFSVFPIFSFSLSTQVIEATSAMDMLLDIQDDINKGKSQLRDYIQQIVSAITYVSKRDPEVYKILKKKGNQAGLVVEVNSLDRVPVKSGPDQISPDLLINTENSYEWGEKVSAVGATLKGQTERSGESGVLFQKKLERAAAVISPYYRNVSRLRKSLMTDYVDNFHFVYGQKDRIVQLKTAKGLQGQAYLNLTFEGAEEGLEVLNNTKNLSLFVELDEGEDSITAVEENFEKSLAIFNLVRDTNPDIASALIGVLVEEAPIRNRDAWLNIIQQMLQAGAEGTARISDLETFKNMLENESIKRGIISDEKRLLIEARKVETEANNDQQNVGAEA